MELNQLGLLDPIYRKTTNYGHFTKSDLPWEQTDRTKALLDVLNGNGAARSEKAGAHSPKHEMLQA